MLLGCRSVEVQTNNYISCRLVHFMYERKVNEERSINEEDAWQEHILDMICQDAEVLSLA